MILRMIGFYEEELEERRKMLKFEEELMVSKAATSVRIVTESLSLCNEPCRIVGTNIKHSP